MPVTPEQAKQAFDQVQQEREEGFRKQVDMVTRDIDRMLNGGDREYHIGSTIWRTPMDWARVVPVICQMYTEAGWVVEESQIETYPPQTVLRFSPQNDN